MPGVANSISHAAARLEVPKAALPAPGPGRWRRLRRGCLNAVQAGLEATGLASLYVRVRKVTGATMFNYHSIARPPEAEWVDPRYHLLPADFERQMRFLSARRLPISLGRLLEAMIEGRDLSPRSVVVTFDDGYLDHLTVAAPILAKYRIPATFFLPTGYVTRVENQWVDSLHASFRRRTRHELLVDGDRFDLSRESGAREAFRRTEAILLTATCPERNAHLRKVDEQLCPEGKAPKLTMDWNDVRSLQGISSDFEIGGHSRDHLDLSALEGSDARREISACAEDLRRELGEAPRDFSFPYERWNPRVREEVRTQGFRSAMGDGPDPLITRDSDRFALPRLDPVTLRTTFGFATSGAYPALSKALTGRA